MAARIKTDLPDNHRMASVRGVVGEVVPNMSFDDGCLANYSHEFSPADKTDRNFYFVNLDEIDTDHSTDIDRMRLEAKEAPDGEELLAAADLLELHDRTGISLDNMAAVRTFVEIYVGHPITPNGV